MTDRTIRDNDPVPEADLAEQSTPAYPDELGYPEDGPDPDGTIAAELAEKAGPDRWNADPADVVEQSIPVPFDDEPDLA
ncbi:hypothetical protein F5X71_32630 [Nocardia brasiliensis]|uniref:Uncharacterized protein n=1 Tax=Nocardia brasiliensis TaxID=37326 RepID=A0A6G9XZS2_NOCBR|nr:hypothetical protein [Nocardia brasiliensis]QIS06421.1 hypothetical protein F5X71_32630 [Nocardia brasiliensis]